MIRNNYRCKPVFMRDTSKTTESDLYTRHDPGLDWFLAL